MSLVALSVAEVEHLVSEGGHPDIAAKLLEDEIDGESLALLSANDFVEYGMKKGPALKLAKKVQDMLSAMRGMSAVIGQDAFVAKMETNASISQRGQDVGQMETKPAIDAFVATWDLDAKCQDVLSQLHPTIQQGIMNDFQPPNLDRANQMFLGFGKNRASNTPASSAQAAWGGNDRASFGEAAVATGDSTIDDFLLKWGLDAASQSVLCSLEPTVMQRVMTDFEPPNPDKANQMFMGFVKAVANRLGSPNGSGSTQKGAPKGGAAVPTGDATIDDFVALWGLDSNSQDAFCQADPSVQEKVVTDFWSSDPARVNPMFMGFLKSVAGRLSQNSWCSQDGCGDGGKSGMPPTPTGGPIDDFVAQWGLDSKAQEALLNLDIVAQERVMSGFNPPNPDRANQMFMGFVKSVSKGGSKGGKKVCWGKGFAPY